MSRADGICTICGIAYPYGMYRTIHRQLTFHRRFLANQYRNRTKPTDIVESHTRHQRGFADVPRLIIMKELFDAGLTYQAIADAYGLSRQRVGQLFAKAGYRRGHPPQQTCFVCGETYRQWRRHATDDEHLRDEADLIAAIQTR